MNKKHKNKSNRGKSSESVPKPIQENKCIENETKECFTETKSESVVPLENLEVIENVPTEAPQPPKRQRKKTKKEQAMQIEVTGSEINDQNQHLQDKIDSEKTCVSTTCEEIQLSEIDVAKDEAQNPQIIQSVVPMARKSKNKNKKKIDTLNRNENIDDMSKEIQESNETNTKNYETIQELTYIVESSEQTPDKTKQQKRKNKKNKNKNEPENLNLKPEEIAETENKECSSVLKKRNDKNLAIDVLEPQEKDGDTKIDAEEIDKKVTVDTEASSDLIAVDTETSRDLTCIGANTETLEQTPDNKQQKKKNKKNKNRNESVKLDLNTSNTLFDIDNAASNPILEVKSKHALPTELMDNTDSVSSETPKKNLCIVKESNENEIRTNELMETIDKLSFDNVDETEWKCSGMKHKKKSKTNNKVQTIQQKDPNLFQEEKEVKNELKEIIELAKEVNTIKTDDREWEIGSCKNNDKRRKNKNLINKAKTGLDSTSKKDSCTTYNFEKGVKLNDPLPETKTEAEKGQSSQKESLGTIEDEKMDIITGDSLLLAKDKIVNKVPELPEKTPDCIEYPRSTSEQSNTNNNTLIKEIESSEELFNKVSLEVPYLIPDTPLVKSTDISSFPVMTPLGVIELEKTDLKSKVIKVNEGLEELRLSIERSLNELTSLENCEQIPDLECYKIEELVATNEIDNVITENIKMSADKKENTRGTENNDLLTQNSEAEIKKEKLIDPTLDNKLDAIFISQTLEEKKDKYKHLLPGQIVDRPIETRSATFSGENNLNCNESNISNQKITEEMYLEKEVKKIEGHKNLPTIQEKLHKESKTEGRKKNKQDFQKSQKGKSLDDCKSKSALTVQSEKSDQKTSAESVTTAEENTQNSEVSKSDPTSKTESSDYSTENKTNEQATSKDAVEVKEDSFELDYDKIDKFEDAMTTSADDVNKSFEIIADEVFIESQTCQSESLKIDMNSPMPECLTSSEEDNEKPRLEKDEKENPLVSNPKNLLGRPDIPVSSNKLDYKKEKNKTPNTKRAEVKIKDSVDIEKRKNQPKQTQTESPSKSIISTVCLDQKPFNIANGNEEYVYKYSFRKVFIVNACHVCKKDLKKMRVPCSFCNLIFYCSEKHKDEDWNQHQSLCFAVSSVVQMKGLKFLYSDAKDVIGQNYRLLRMQAIVSCEKILQRKLMPCEQEALLYPRICAETSCREWKHDCLKDCEGCNQIAYCKNKPEHFPKTHQRWCKSYHLYQKLVIHQQTKGRLEPKLPTKIITNAKFQLPDKINELLAALYEERIDIDDMHYAALTQLATAPLTAAYCYQLYDNNMNKTFANGIHKKSTFTVHLIGAELQFEADALNKWEIFFLHLRPDVKDLNVALIGNNLNPSNLPLELLSKIKLCQYCQESKRRLRFGFYDKKYYFQFYDSDDFNIPDIVCAFNPSIHRAFFYNENDYWIANLESIFKTRAPFCVTAYTPNDLTKDLARIKECAESKFRIVTPPSPNPYASIRPDRNFISDDEMPLIFKNYYYMILSSAS